jgi:hypothetical protein
MPQIDPRDAELIAVAANVVGRLVVAHAHGNTEAVAGELARLLAAVATYTAGITERRDDAALIRAIERLGGT